MEQHGHDMAPPPEVPRAPRRRAKWVVGVGLLLAGIGGITAWAFASPGAVSYYATPSELTVAPGDPGRQLRLGGRVAPGTLDRDGSSVRFGVTDGSNVISVTYHGEVPDTLKEETDVIAEGVIGPDGVLVANRVLAKCSSKYVPVEDADEHLGRTAASG